MADLKGAFDWAKLVELLAILAQWFADNKPKQGTEGCSAKMELVHSILCKQACALKCAMELHDALHAEEQCDH